LGRAEIVGLVLWLAAEFVVAILATRVLVDKGLSLPRHRTFGRDFVLGWVEKWPAAMLGMAVLAGALVFRRDVPWRLLLSWPWTVGFAVGCGFIAALTDQMESGSRMCHMGDGGSCDTTWGAAGALVGSSSAARSCSRLR
jgi:hypothetical protein